MNRKEIKFTCEVCGREFTSTAINARYCNRRCRSRQARNQEKRKVNEMVTVPQMGHKVNEVGTWEELDAWAKVVKDEPLLFKINEITESWEPTGKGVEWLVDAKGLRVMAKQ